jgi:hypothetical protein
VSGANANQFLFSTLAMVLDFADSRAPEDDLSLLVVRRCEAASTRRISELDKNLPERRREQMLATRPRQTTNNRHR